MAALARHDYIDLLEQLMYTISVDAIGGGSHEYCIKKRKHGKWEGGGGPFWTKSKPQLVLPVRPALQYLLSGQHLTPVDYVV